MSLLNDGLPAECQMRLQTYYALSACRVFLGCREANLTPFHSAEPSVLIVEDHALIALDLQEMLHKCRARATMIAYSVKDALMLLSGQRFDVAFLDLQLVDGDSFPVAIALAQLNTPFAFSTGYQTLNMLPVELQNRPVIYKPYQERDVESVLKQMLQ